MSVTMPDKIVMRSPSDLIPYDRNPKTHPADQIEQLKASIREWGWTIPILIDEASGVIAGHGRLYAASEMGLEEVPCIVASDWPEDKKRAYVIADNRLAENGAWDDALLTEEFAALAGSEFDLPLTGFGLDEIDKMTDGSMLEFDAPELEVLSADWLDEDAHIPETNVKQFMLLYDIETLEEMKNMVSRLSDVYHLENPSDVVLMAVRNEYENNSNP